MHFWAQADLLLSWGIVYLMSMRWIDKRWREHKIAEKKNADA
jgi:hypothetical protein